MTTRARSLEHADATFALRIVAILLAFHVLIVVGPLAYSAWISFHDRDVILRTNEFVGFAHYQRVLSSPEALDSILLTLQFSAVVVVLSLIMGLGMALVLNEEFPGRSILRAAILLPWAISEVVTATAFIFITNPTFGALTGILHRLGLAAENAVWINEHTALYWVAVAFVWHIAPLGAFFFLAALQTIPENLYRAARIDRASGVMRFVHITLPHLRSTVMIVLVIVTIEAFRTFDLLFAMTRGGPGTASQIFSMLIFRYTFEFSRYGLAAAASYIMVIIGLIVTVAYFLLLMRRRKMVLLDQPAVERPTVMAARTPVGATVP